MRGKALVIQAFLAFVLVALLTALVEGLMTRTLVSGAFTGYVEHFSQQQAMGRGMGMGRMILGAAEQTFLAGVDRGMLLAAVLAVAVAAVAALLLARSLSAPLARLEHAAVLVAAGDLQHRVDVRGPEEVERLAGAFNDMAASLAEAESLRRRLVADVAHELRNPLAAARAQAEGMMEGILPADDKRLASVVEDLEQLSRLVDDLQELSIAEAGGLTYDMERVDLCEIVAREAERAADASSGGGTRVFATECLEHLWVDGDASRLSQVLRNMLSNAARHTPDGTVEVSVGRVGGDVEVRVTDTGEGIPPEDLPHIFERFYRADAARARDTGGSGVGLAIASRIVRDHGGRVFATSIEGEGAVVGFALRAEEARP